MSSLQNQDQFGLPPWMLALRTAAQDAIKPADITEIVRQQVERAKKGDDKAIRFVFDYALGGSALKGATFVQNNFTGEAAPNRPTAARPGTNGKLRTMEQRAAAGLPLSRADDGPMDSLD